MPKWLERLLKIEPGVSLYQWVFDRINNNWDRLVGLLGASVMTYLGYITEWVKAWGPFGFGLAFIGTFLIYGLIRYLYELIAIKKSYRNAVELGVAVGKVNVLRREFRDERLNVADFFNPYYIPTERRTFTNCELIGPANFIMLGRDGITARSHFRGCQFVVLKPGEGGNTAVLGVVALVDCTIMDCTFVGCTFFVVPEWLERIRHQIHGELNVITYEPRELELQ